MPGPLDPLIPFVITLVLLGLSYAPWMRKEGSWAFAPAIALAFVVAFRIIVGQFPPFPAADATSWIFYVAIVACVAGVASHLWRLPRWVLVILGAVVGAAAAAAVLRTQLIREATQHSAIAWVAGAGIVAGVWTLCFAGDTTRERPKTTLVGITVLTLFCGVLMGMSASFIYGRLGVALAGGLAAVTAVTLFTRKPDPVPAIIVTCPTLLALLVASARFAELTLLSVILIALAPVAFHLCTMKALPRRPFANALISVTCMTLLLAVAIGAALPGFLRTITDPTDLYGP